MVESPRKHPRVVIEERRRGIRERVVIQRPDRDARRIVQGAPHGRDANEQNVATWQVYGLIWSFIARNIFTGGAPVVAVQATNGHLQRRQRPDVRQLERSEVGSKGALLTLLPGEAGFDVD